MKNSENIKIASNAALASLLNLSLLPGLAFIWLLLNKNQTDELAKYHFNFAIKLNLIAAVALFVVSALMIYLGGFESPWTWVYVISYFTLVHGGFIMLAVWLLTRAYSGKAL